MSQQRALVILYTRPGCHLCEEAKEQMLEADCTDLYALEEINIETDPSLIELYGMKIPVITIDGVEAFKYRVTTEAFRKALVSLNAA